MKPTIFAFLILIQNSFACEDLLNEQRDVWSPHMGNAYLVAEIANEVSEALYKPSSTTVAAELCSSALDNDSEAFLDILETEMNETHSSVRAIHKGVLCSSVDGNDPGSLLKASIKGAMSGDSDAIFQKLIARESGIDLEMKEIVTVLEKGKKVRKEKTIIEWLDIQIANPGISDRSKRQYRRYREVIQSEINARKKRGERDKAV